MIEKTTTIDRIEVSSSGNLDIRYKTIFTENGVQVSDASFSREVLNPGDDVSGFPSNVIQIAQITWTPEIIAAYQARIAESAV